jgi:hypothetical protein
MEIRLWVNTDEWWVAELEGCSALGKGQAPTDALLHLKNQVSLEDMDAVQSALDDPRRPTREANIYWQHRFNGTRWYMPLGPLVTEEHTNQGVKWGVSLCGPNPDPWLWSFCRDRMAAQRLVARLRYLRCPKCACPDIIEPAEMQPKFTCEACGHDFAPDGWRVGVVQK